MCAVKACLFKCQMSRALALITTPPSFPLQYSSLNYWTAREATSNAEYGKVARELLYCTVAQSLEWREEVRKVLLEKAGLRQSLHLCFAFFSFQRCSLNKLWAKYAQSGSMYSTTNCTSNSWPFIHVCLLSKLRQRIMMKLSRISSPQWNQLGFPRRNIWVL